MNADGSLFGAEMLVRWIHPQKGIISPDSFIDKAEENGQIVKITTQLINRCIESFHTANFSENTPFHLGINACPM